MTRNPRKNKALRYAVCSAMAAALVAGCAGSGKLAGGSGSAAAQMSQSELDRAVGKAEGAVEKDPRNAALRAALADVYIQTGRFESAATTYQDAMALGDGSPRTALSLSLAHVGSGRGGQAVAILDNYRDSIPSSDLGLAYALAGETGRGVTILAEALRGGENHAKLRQNLAYAYALDGRWREARLMAAQDVPADQLDARISAWALKGKPGDYRARVAGLLGAPVRSDSGQPQYLALDAAPVAPAMAAADVPPPPPLPLPVRSGAELPAIAEASEPYAEAWSRPASHDMSEAPAPPAQSFDTAFEAPAYTSKAVVQPAPRSSSSQRPATLRKEVAAARTEATIKPEECTHLVQLGSFSSPESAQRAWKIFQGRTPELKNYDLQITEAVVRGKRYWRVAATGFDKSSARSLCSSVKGRGGGCIAYAVDRPLPGAIQGRNAGGPMKAR